MAVRKIEFDVLPECVGSHVSTDVNGARMMPSLSLRPYPNLKIESPGLWVGATFCINLRAPCPTMRALCWPGGSATSCKYAIFNPNLLCCPRGVVYTSSHRDWNTQR
jgi:hypothetical protein